MDPITTTILYAFEMLASYIFFSRITKRKMKPRCCILIGLALFECAAFINIILRGIVWVNTVTFISGNFVFAFICFHFRPFIALCYSVILDAINYALELIVILVVSALTHNDAPAFNSDLLLFMLEVPTNKLLYFFSCLLLARFVNRQNHTSRIPFSLFSYPLSTVICLSIIWNICAKENISNNGQYLLCVVSMLLFFSTILVFVTYQHQTEQDAELAQIKGENNRLQTEKSYYDILEQQNQQLMIYAHDAKKHLAAIQELSVDPRIDSYIVKLSEQLKSYSKNCHSGNKLLDVMIGKYLLECERNNIHMDYDIKSCNLLSVADIDLVAILGNLMDNALTAASASAERELSLSTTMRNGYQVIIIVNSCDTLPSVSGKDLLTTKQDRSAHGYGMKSVAKTLKKYDGDYSWEYDEHSRKFYMTVMIGQG